MSLHSLSSARETLLFVYGTLRPGSAGDIAAWLASVSHHIGPATARGTLYRIDFYPGFVPGEEGQVLGDLVLLPDADALLPLLDEHEECSPAFARPHEYRRERLIVEGADGPVEAWAYVYAHATAGLERIEGGDFLE